MTIDPGSIWRFSLQPSSTVANRPTRRLTGSERIVANPDFTAFVQRAKDTKPEAIYIWIPGGAQPAAVGTALPTM